MNKYLWLAMLALVAGLFLYSGCSPREAPTIPTRPIAELQIGDRVVDRSWDWEHRIGDNYTGSGETKPVTWIVVGKNHYQGLGDHVTLLSEELVARMAFDNSKNKGSDRGNNHWGNSGTPDATHGIRPFLNSLDKSAYAYEGAGFYDTFSESFQNAVLVTPLPNKDWKEGSLYTTEDRVFLLSQTELGTADEYTHKIGAPLPYFAEDSKELRIAYFGEKSDWYMSRSPNAGLPYRVRLINSRGEPDTYYHANYPNFAVRPAVNVRADLPVSETADQAGVYEIIWR